MAAVVEHSYEIVDVDSVRSHPDNPRVGSVDAIATSIEANGFFGALVVQRSTGYILVGNHRHAAAKATGLRELPAIVVDIDDERAQRILIADNRLAEFATWNDDALGALLAQLAASSTGLTGTGYTDSQLADILNADSFEPTDETNRVDVSGEHECPSCGYKWRLRADGGIVES